MTNLLRKSATAIPDRINGQHSNLNIHHHTDDFLHADTEQQESSFATRRPVLLPKRTTSNSLPKKHAAAAASSSTVTNISIDDEANEAENTSPIIAESIDSSFYKKQQQNVPTIFLIKEKYKQYLDWLNEHYASSQQQNHHNQHLAW
jgi:hypothetical protein